MNIFSQYKNIFRFIFLVSITHLLIPNTILIASLKLETIELRPDLPSGEEWFTPESTNKRVRSPDEKWVHKIKSPTIEVYRAPNPNGTAIIIAPGGGFKLLAIEHEGRDVAKWLNGLGISAFILHYRCGLELDENPKINREFNAINAIDDGLTAMKIVRQRAKDFNIDPKRIGVLGFSAGGLLVTGIATSFTLEDRPDFVISIYPVVPLLPGPIPQNLPPMFTATAFDDKIVDALQLSTLMNTWKIGKASLEAHIFPDGDHGFGMIKQGTSSDIWTELVENWLKRLGFIHKI